MFAFRRLALIAIAALTLAAPVFADTATDDMPLAPSTETEVSLAPETASPPARKDTEIAMTPSGTPRRPSKRSAIAPKS